MRRVFYRWLFEKFIGAVFYFLLPDLNGTLLQLLKLVPKTRFIFLRSIEQYLYLLKIFSAVLSFSVFVAWFWMGAGHVTFMQIKITII